MPTSLTLRTVKGSPLTNAEVDGNFSSLRDEKIERDGSIAMTGKLTFVAPNASRANIRLSEGAADPTSPSTGDFWNNTGVIKFRKDGSTTVNIITSETGQTFSGDVVISGNLTVNGTTTTINSTQLSVDDKNIILGDVSSPTDTTADGGGITLKGTLDKTFNWVDATDSWTSSEHLDLANGKAFKINTANVLSSTTLGSSVVASSLTSVGTLGSLTVTNPITGSVTGTSSGWSTGRTITLTGDVTGVSSAFDGTGNLSFATTIAANSVALGTDTTGDYVGAVIAGTGVSTTGASTGEGISHTISIGQAVGTTSGVTFGNINVGSATGATTGQVRASGDIIAFASSDARLKTDIAVISDALTKVKTLRGVTYTWNETAQELGLHGADTGVIAQEVLAVLPEVVTTRDNGHMAVKYEKMIGLLIEAIKELDAKVDKCTCNK